MNRRPLLLVILTAMIMLWLPCKLLASDLTSQKAPLNIEIKLQNRNNDAFMKKVRKIDASISCERIITYTRQRLSEILGKLEIPASYTNFVMSLRFAKGNLEGKIREQTVWVEVISRGTAVLSGKPPSKRITARATGYAGLFSMPFNGDPSQWTTITYALDGLLPPILGTFVKRGFPRQPIMEILFELLNSSGGEVRVAAAKALGQIGDPKAVDPLIKALLTGGSESGMIATALARFHDPRAIGPMKQQLSSLGPNSVGYGEIKQALHSLEGKKPKR
jgi:hypothetical protein